MSEQSRRYERVIQDIDVSLTDLDGTALDEHAAAQDISPAGFRCSTRAPLEIGSQVFFELRMEDQQRPIKGRAKAVWLESDRWGGTIVGFKITKMPWSDRARLRGGLENPGYDFVGLARKAAIALFWIVLAGAAHNIAFHQPEVRRTMGAMLPVAAGACVLGLGLWIAKSSGWKR